MFPIQLIGLLFFVLWRDEPRRQRLTTACRTSATARIVVGSIHFNDGTVNIQRETHFQTIRVGNRWHRHLRARDGRTPRAAVIVTADLRMCGGPDQLERRARSHCQEPKSRFVRLARIIL